MESGHLHSARTWGRKGVRGKSRAKTPVPLLVKQKTTLRLSLIGGPCNLLLKSIHSESGIGHY